MNDTTTTTTTVDAETGPDFSAAIDLYLQAYNERDATRRVALIEQAFQPDAHLFDPPIEGAGHDGINEMFATVQGMFAEHSFRRSTGIDAHHGIARYGWELVAADGTVALAGMDVAVIESDGRLNRVAGFFGDLPALES
ncbi:MAG: hypothetical protein JWL72_3620 [Ilumatobacteraceae bacterium]|nr:hypothetical protein [Ilumatobacteraceae bacterium]MCU1390282.1 hypothetical protein [Ilumatobacteraceae bacterium]